MGFRVDFTMTQKNQFFLVTNSGKFFVHFRRFDAKVGAMPDILTIWLSEWVFLATSMIDFAILSGGNSRVTLICSNMENYWIRNPGFA